MLFTVPHIISSPGYLGRCFTNTSTLSSVQSRKSHFKNCTLLRKAVLVSKPVWAKIALIWIEIVFYSNISKRKMQGIYDSLVDNLMVRDPV